MSQPGGRGFGRAGRGDPKKAGGDAHSRPPASRASRFDPGPSQPSTSESTVGESRVGFPQGGTSELLRKTSSLKIGEKGRGEKGSASGGGDGRSKGKGSGNGNGNGSTPIGRGGMRGRRPITVAEIVKTKPETCISKQGDFGTKVELVTNYFKLETMTNWILYQYRVDFSVEEERESVLRSWLRQHKERLNAAYIFDGTMLFTSQRFTAKNEVLTLTSFREGDNLPITVTIKLVQQLMYGNVVYLQIFNILVRRCLLHLNLQLVNRNYFDPKASIQLQQHNLEVWPGYVTAIRQHEKYVLMCAEITHKVMRTDTALQFLKECMKEGGDYRKVYQQNMIGCIILTDYNNKTYRIDDVDFSQSPLSSFKYRNDEFITYIKYYQERYQIRITDMNQPLLISRASPRDLRGGKDAQCLLVPELCRMTGLSNKMLENRILMKDLSEITRIGPSTRIERLRGFNSRLQSQPLVVEDFKQWGMSLSRDLMTVPGREFPPEQILSGNQVTYSSGQDVDWTRSMRSTPMLYCAKFDSFAVICPSRIRREVDEFLNNLKKAADGMSFRIPRPFIIETNTDSPMHMVEATENAICRVRPDLILYGFTSDRTDRYSAVKKKCYVDRGVLSQVVLARNMKAKGVMSIATKVAVQINSKIGGAPWTIHIPSDNVMVIGYDVCHDKSKKSDSVGAVVASLNKAMSVWFSSVNYHTSGEELSDTIAVDICKAIRKYREYNKDKLPTRIFFYRDGVGEGQINYVYKHEVVALKKKLTELYGGETWKMAYIVVTKRIHTRFFNKGQNPRPGTIVDDVVTLPEKYDFYLVSQSVRQGTVTPTSYNVISDNLDWAANHIQRFTYKMTHLYYNCSSTVRVPAPCQYAHKLAFMVSQNLHGIPHVNLNTKLFFL